MELSIDVTSVKIPMTMFLKKVSRIGSQVTQTEPISIQGVPHEIWPTPYPWLTNHNNVKRSSLTCTAKKNAKTCRVRGELLLLFQAANLLQFIIVFISEILKGH